MLKFSFLIRRPPEMDLDAFVDYHRNSHAPLFMSIPESEKYVKKYVVSHPNTLEGFPVPAYDGVTDIYFDSMDDFNSFFTSENYKLKVHPDESNFIVLSDVLILISDELIVKA
ncbi:EthD domain-containing protein [Sphingobacterium sp. JB170]|uniref:EthD domain-containing protein n=1 Tax=Sphingobacterium sp. JB170 TaxID=1434842 RepID=UPI00097EC9D7|nr:EthD domain-containing protein [Sphingobacterium sp. JB170]SJN48914.1 Ethyl tert-butyl ether degradation EthD [Sphingobacterium sp. JB170]